MTRHTLDPLTLDRLVCGTDDASDRAAWAALVGDPDADTLWFAAVERRRQLDALAALFEAHPWLARPMTEVNRGIRRAMKVLQWPGMTISVRPAVALAMLDAEGPGERAVTLAPGMTRIERVKIGEILCFETPTGTTLHHVTSTGTRSIGVDPWCMEPGDSPVVLLAVHTTDTETPVATLILIEAQSGENHP